MEIRIKHFGGSRNSPSKIIELTVTRNNITLTFEVTDLKGRVDKNLIENFREIASELEEQNTALDNPLLTN